MKKIILIIAATLISAAAFSQEKPKKENKFLSHFQPYGFIRVYAAFDTRESKALTEDFFYYLPMDRKIVDGVDVNEVNSFRFAALTSRLGINVVNVEFKDWKFGAKIEGDFYAGLTGTKQADGSTGSSVTGTAQFRLRQAFATLSHKGFVFKFGQAWHPMAADMPDVFSLNTGAPFGPFSRTPQIDFSYTFQNGLGLEGDIIWQMQYTSAGPNGASADYIKYGCVPEFYLGLNYGFKGGLFRLGADIVTIAPTHGVVNGKMHKDRITTISPFLYGQYKTGNFSIKAKTVFAQAGEHVNLNGGYGVKSFNEDGSIDYTPTMNSSSWVSLMYKLNNWDFILFGGYVKNFGTVEELASKALEAPHTNLYFSKNSFSNMDSMWRTSPTVVYNFGKFAAGIEYEMTGVKYGDWNPETESWGLATDNLHVITNHRVQALFKFTF